MRSDYIILGNSIIDGDVTAMLLELRTLKKRSHELEIENRELRRTLKRVGERGVNALPNWKREGVIAADILHG